MVQPSPQSEHHHHSSSNWWWLGFMTSGCQSVRDSDWSHIDAVTGSNDIRLESLIVYSLVSHGLSVLGFMTDWVRQPGHPSAQRRVEWGLWHQTVTEWLCLVTHLLTDLLNGVYVTSDCPSATQSGHLSAHRQEAVCPDPGQVVT